jgi:hypothetical protein
MAQGMLGVGAALMACFFFWSGAQQLTQPWGQRITGELRAAGADASAMAAALLLQGLAMALCAWGMLIGRPPKGEARTCAVAPVLPYTKLTTFCTCNMSRADM